MWCFTDTASTFAVKSPKMSQNAWPVLTPFTRGRDRTVALIFLPFTRRHDRIVERNENDIHRKTTVTLVGREKVVAICLWKDIFLQRWILLYLFCIFSSSNSRSILALLWLLYGIGQAIIFLPCGFFLSSSIFFPRLISAVADWMSTMQAWNVLHMAHWKCRTQKIAKNCHLGTIAQFCRAISSQLRHVSTIAQKNC